MQPNAINNQLKQVSIATYTSEDRVSLDTG